MKEEAAFQKSVVTWFRKNYPDYVIFSVPNEATYHSTAKFKALGMLSGASDLVMILPNVVLFLECKSAQGKLRKEQKEFRDKCKALNHNYFVIKDLQDVKAILREHLYCEDWRDL